MRDDICKWWPVNVVVVQIIVRRLGELSSGQVRRQSDGQVELKGKTFYMFQNSPFASPRKRDNLSLFLFLSAEKFIEMREISDDCC